MPKVLPIPQSGGGRSRSRRTTTSLAEINVIPLVDVMLVLLIIFMVAAPMIQRGVEVNLPVSQRSPEISKERVFVTVPLSYRQDRRVFLDNDAIRMEVLEERIRQTMLNRSDKEVYLRGDGGIQLQELIEVMDRLKQAGVEKVGIVSKRPGER